MGRKPTPVPLSVVVGLFLLVGGSHGAAGISEARKAKVGMIDVLTLAFILLSF